MKEEMNGNPFHTRQIPYSNEQHKNTHHNTMHTIHATFTQPSLQRNGQIGCLAHCGSVPFRTVSIKNTELKRMDGWMNSFIR
mmetsp:Transcript_23666/g.48481  ORF Transcript_23666/g.48481 Transcript_23666/m.48481 type:complete len:82 (+) Transcript_23666:495-740(+)